MSEKDRSRQRVASFINELNQGTASLTDEGFARLKRIIVERRGRDAAYVTVVLIDTAQPWSPRRVVQKYRSVYKFVWRETTRAGWTRSEVSSNNHRLVQVSSNNHRLVRISSNHHRLVRVLKHPDGSVSRTGRQDKPLPQAACSWAWVRI